MTAQLLTQRDLARLTRDLRLPDTAQGARGLVLLLSELGLLGAEIAAVGALLVSELREVVAGRAEVTDAQHLRLVQGLAAVQWWHAARMGQAWAWDPVEVTGVATLAPDVWDDLPQDLRTDWGRIHGGA